MNYLEKQFQPVLDSIKTAEEVEKMLQAQIDLKGPEWLTIALQKKLNGLKTI
jgi:hypothetical protein